jgi:beta-fructofuranosidase
MEQPNAPPRMPPRDPKGNLDPNRPKIHFLPPAHWMNDPCGLLQWKGNYHLFYQYNPYGAAHANMHWGHAVSRDLVHWQDLPIALAPTPGGADRDGCWSGCAVDDGGVPTLIYTGVSPQVVCLATSSDDLLTWQKYEDNPVIGSPPLDVQGQTGGNFRDPYVWRDEEHWYLAIASRIEGVGGAVLLYRSRDLVHWKYLRPLLVGDVTRSDPFWTGITWECPNMVRLGAKWALLVSVQASPFQHLHPIYYTGRWQDERFAPETQGVLVHGGYFYAPQVMRLDGGRHVLWGWVAEGRSQRICEWAGWAGTMSLPLDVSMEADGRLSLQPVPELQALRQEHRHYRNLPASEPTALLGDVQGDVLEIQVEFDLDPGAELGVTLRCSPGGQERTEVVYRQAQTQLAIERAQSSLSLDTERDERVAPVEPVAGKPSKLHIFVDGSVVEAFAGGGRTSLASRIYPLRPDSLGAGVFVRNGSARIYTLDIWTLRSIWPDQQVGAGAGRSRDSRDWR